MHSPCLDLRFFSNAELSFWYHAYGAAIGALHLDAIVDGVFYKDIMPVIEGEQGNQWDSVYVDLTPFVGNYVVLAFRGMTGNGYQADLAIDDVNIEGQMSVVSTESLAAETVTDFVVYPNPTNGRCIVDLKKTYESATVQVRNTLGQY